MTPINTSDLAQNCDPILLLGNPLFVGQSRDVFAHPDEPEWLVKVGRQGDSAGAEMNRLELASYRQVRGELGDYLTTYRTSLCNTSKGQGLLCKKVLDVDGKLSSSWAEWAVSYPQQVSQLMVSFEQFFEALLAGNHYFFDFNDGNFLLQDSPRGYRIKFIDLKSYRLDRAMLPLTRWFESAARRKLERRRDRFLNRWFGR